MVRLPKCEQAFDDMTVSQVRILVSNLVCLTESRRRPGFNDQSNKPRWWPKHISFCQFKDYKDQRVALVQLGTVARRCYEYYRKVSLMHPKDSSRARRAIRKRAKPTQGPQEQTIDGSSSGDDAVQSPAKMVSRTGYVTWNLENNTSHAEDAAVPISMSDPVPAKTCNGNYDDMKAKLSRNDKRFLDVYICFYCEKEFMDRSDHNMHQSTCSRGPPTLTQVSPPRPCRLRLPPPLSPMSTTKTVKLPEKSKFAEALGLIPLQRAESLRACRQSSHVEHYDLIDLTADEPQPPKTPITPKGSRCQVSILSRDLSPTSRSKSTEGPQTPSRRSSRRSESTHKGSVIGIIGSLQATTPLAGDENSELAEGKTVLGSIGPPLAATIKLEIAENPLEDLKENKDTRDDESDSESMSSKSDGGETRPQNHSSIGSLLSIDLSSPLGQRLKDHYVVEKEKEVQNFIVMNKNYEEYCHTPKKNAAVERLRNRPDMRIPVTYKPKKKKVPTATLR